MIKSHLELYVLEILCLMWLHVFIVNWIITLIAAASINPTVCVFLWVMSEFYECAYLRHDLVFVANVRCGHVDAAAA